MLVIRMEHMERSGEKRMDLKLPEKSLVVFVDDTGHERLVEGHPVYGLGGCAALAGDLDWFIRNPWRDVRRRVMRSADARLHAHGFARSARHEDFEAVAQFFRTQPFARLGAIISAKAARDDGISAVTAIAGVLKNRIIDIARWTPFTELHVFFEASGRADRLMEEAFSDFRVEENGRAIPVECFFMPKSVGEPALEVADFVMHAVGRQARHRMEGKDGFVRDFAAVFHDQDPKRVSFMDVNAAKWSA
jgi:hypothetical protein